MLDVAAAAGMTCVKCRTDVTSVQWCNCKDEPGTKICTSCHKKNQRNQKKAASTNEK